MAGGAPVKAPAKAPAAPRTPSTHDRIVTGSRAVQSVPTSSSSTKGSALKGAAGGAAAGASVGSIVPGVGTAVGAGVGAAVGGAGGAVKARAAKKEAKRAKRAALGPGRRLLVAEFVLCLVILALSPLTDKHKSEGPTAFLRRGSAVCALFFILALISSGGRGATKVAAAFGGLVTLTLLVSSRDVFAVLAAKFASTSDGSPAGPTDVGDVAGDAAGDQAGAAVGGAVADQLATLDAGARVGSVLDRLGAAIRAAAGTP